MSVPHSALCSALPPSSVSWRGPEEVSPLLEPAKISASAPGFVLFFFFKWQAKPQALGGKLLLPHKGLAAVLKQNNLIPSKTRLVVFFNPFCSMNNCPGMHEHQLIPPAGRLSRSWPWQDPASCGVGPRSLPSPVSHPCCQEQDLAVCPPVSAAPCSVSPWPCSFGPAPLWEAAGHWHHIGPSTRGQFHQQTQGVCPMLLASPTP